MELKKIWQRLGAPQEGKHKPWLLFALGLAGILLLFFSDLAGRQQAPAAAADSASAYTAALEQRLLETLAAMDGVGRVKVMLTAADGGETVYAAEERSRSQQSGTGSENSYENNYVLVDGGSGRGALIESARQPEIRGAAIVCEGGGDISVIRRVTDVVAVVLGIPTNRICVTKMN